MLISRYHHTIPFMTIITGALICGIIASAYEWIPYIPASLCIGIILCALCSLFLFNASSINTIFKKGVLLVCITVFGAFLYQRQCIASDEFYAYIGNKKFDIIGTIYNIRDIQHKNARQRITISCMKIKKINDNTWKKIPSMLYVYITHKTNALINDTIQINSLLCSKPHKSSFQSYLIKEGIAGTIFLKNLNAALIHRPTISFARWLHTTKKHLAQRLEKKLSLNESPLFSSLFLGETMSQKKQMESTRDLFKTWGLLHYLARSGLHLIIFILLWSTILRLLPLPFDLKHGLLLFLSLIYFLCSWSSISFIRAFSTFILYKFCVIHKKQPHLLYLLSTVCLITLLYNPIQLFFLDFQLSFSLTFALIWLNQIRQIHTHQKTNH